MGFEEGFRSREVFVVNDEPIQLKVLCSLVRRAGLEPRPFLGAQGALEALDPKAPPALVVTDLHMPGMDGWQFCRVLRSGPFASFQGVPILAVSATCEGVEPRRMAAELGVEGFLPAPVEGRVFAEEVRRILRGLPSGRGLRALILEEDPAWAQVLAQAFEAEGYEVVSVRSLEEAEPLLGGPPWDVAVLGDLAEGDSEDLLPRLGDPCLRFLVRREVPKDRREAWLRRGATACLSKPVLPETLLERTARAWRERDLVRAEGLLEQRTRELRRSEERFAALVEELPALVCEFAPDSTLTFVNRAYQEDWGGREKDLLGRSFLDLVPPEVRDDVERDVRSLTPTNPTNRVVHQAYRGGELRWTQWHNRALFDEEGRVRRYFAIGMDVTDRVRVEEDLRERERFLSAVLRTTPDGFWVVDSRGRFCDVNQAYLDLSGYDRGEFLGMTISQIDADEAPEETEARIERIRTGGSETFEARHRRKDGSVFPVEISTSFVPDAGGHFVCFCRDLTERKRREDRIALLGTMLDAAPVSITIHDEEGRFFYANQATLDLHGYPDREAFLALPLGHLDVPESVVLLEERFRRIFQDGEARFESSHYRKDGSVLPLEVRAKAIRWYDAPAVLSVARSLEPRLQEEREKDRLRQQLLQAQKMESVGRLAGGVAHDFNNMLGVILGRCELALEGLDSPSPLVADLEEIRKAAERSAELTRQLLAFARKQTATPRVMDLNVTVEGMLQMLRRLLGEDVDLVWKPGRNLGRVRVDPGQVDQILANLCVNARDALVPGGGQVVIETGEAVLREPDPILGEEGVSGNYVVLSVRDNGCGMTPEVRAHLFEPFFTTKEVGRGTGLGLATVYGIARQNQGWVDVQSEPDRGTVFRIFLPRLEEEVSAPPPQEKGRAASGQETVLLVEDEESILRMAELMLRHLGYGVLAASGPREALRLATEHPGEIRLLLTDVVMPGMNGRDLAERLLEVHPNLRVLFTSGYPADHLAPHGVVDQGVSFLQKPFTLQALAAKARSLLDRGEGGSVPPVVDGDPSPQ